MTAGSLTASPGMGTEQARPAARTGVSTIDVWKTLALALILVDHVGHFLLPDMDWLRVLGRASLPLWFFLIGHGGGRGVPWTWLGLGALLTALDLWWVGSLELAQLNILFSFAAIRLALPAIETHIWPHRWRLAALVLALIVLAPFANEVIEYGTEGALLALVGTAHRRWKAGIDGNGLVLRLALAAVAGTVFVAMESSDYGFDAGQTTALAVLIGVVSLALVRFRRAELSIPPAPVPAAILRFCGRYSLWLYAGQIVLLTLVATVLGIEPEDDDSEETET